MRNILIGNCRDRLRELPAESVQCVVTSPPYLWARRYDGEQAAAWGGDPDCVHDWQWRRYYLEQSTGRTGREAFAKPGAANIARLQAARWRKDAICARCGAWHGAFGLEPTPELYAAHTAEILREIRRVLRSDGVVWWNLADTYAGSGGAHAGRCPSPGVSDVLAAGTTKPKDLCLVPSLVALAARADGWWIRSMVTWEKANCQPEPVHDRPTESHEYILLLTKSRRYFYDADAVREPLAPTTLERNRYGHRGSACSQVAVSRPRAPGEQGYPGGRNLRSVWRFPTVPYPGAHFAVFPPELPRRCILAGSPPKVCAECGAPWRRTPDQEPGRPAQWKPTCRCHGSPDEHTLMCQDCGGSGGAFPDDPCDTCSGLGEVTVTVWAPGTLEAWPTRPPIILDPFAGSGTTLMVAESLGRWWIGIDICAAYESQIRARTSQRSLMEALQTTAAEGATHGAR